jgi:hypothetical protein
MVALQINGMLLPMAQVDKPLDSFQHSPPEM